MKLCDSLETWKTSEEAHSISLWAGSSCFPTTRIKSDISLSAYKLAIFVTTCRWAMSMVNWSLEQIEVCNIQTRISKSSPSCCTSLELSMSMTGEGAGLGRSDEPCNLHKQTAPICSMCMERNKLRFEGRKKDSLILYLPLKTEPFTLTSPLLFQLRLNTQGQYVVFNTLSSWSLSPRW